MSHLSGKCPAQSVHAGQFECFHNWPVWHGLQHSDLDCRVFNEHMWSFACAHIRGDHSLWSRLRDIFGVCTEFDSREIWGHAQSSSMWRSPSTWWPCLTVLHLAYGTQQVFSLCAIISPTLILIRSCYPRTLVGNDEPAPFFNCLAAKDVVLRLSTNLWKVNGHQI